MLGETRPVGWQDFIHWNLTRRELLVGGLSTPALLCASSAGAENDWWYDLDIELSVDLKFLTVRERYVATAQGKADGADTGEKDDRPATPAWVIPIAAFGPNAFFDMAEPAEAPIGPAGTPVRTIYIRNVEYGLRFPAGAQEMGFVGFRFRRPGKRWTIEYVTNLWLRLDGSTSEITSETALFSGFLASATPDAQGAAVAGRTLPFLNIAYYRVNLTLREMFADEVSTGSAPGDFRVMIDRNLVWTMIGRSGRRLSLLEGQVEASVFSFAWRQGGPADTAPPAKGAEKGTTGTGNAPAREGNGAAGTGETPAAGSPAKAPGKEPVFVYFSGFAGPDALALTSPDRILRLGEAHQVAAKPSDLCAMRLDVVVGASPFLPSTAQVVSALSFGEGVIALRDAGKVLTDGITGEKLVFAQTTLPGLDKTRTRRAALWGSATGVGTSIFTEDLVKPVWHRPGDIATPIGRLRIGRPAFEVPEPETSADAVQGLTGSEAAPAVPDGATAAEAATTGVLQITVTDGNLAESCPPLEVEDRDKAQLGRIFRASAGDRGGAPDSTIFCLYERPNNKPGRLRRIHVDLSLFASDAALPDTSFSRLTFRSAALRLIYEDGLPIAELMPAGEYPRPIASSFVWMGPLAGGARRASFDLTAATLACARDYDLMKLKLRFHDLVLDYRAQPEIRPAREDARVWVGADGTVHDTRPVLVAEFDPQHVFEEAIFRPEAPELPDVDLERVEGIEDYMKHRETILARLEEQTDAKARAEIRTKVRAAKEAAETGQEKPFTGLAKAFAGASSFLPVDQRDYVGPFALDADGMALARQMMRTTGKGAVERAVDAMLKRVEKLAAPDSQLHKDGRLVPMPDPDPNTPPQTSFQNALRNEGVFEALEPLYGVFRNFWRDRQVKYVALRRKGATDYDIFKELGFLVPPDADPLKNGFLAEFLSVDNRFPVYEKASAAVAALRGSMVSKFVDFAMGLEAVPDLVGGRLSGSSRLAFRIDCEPPAGVDAQEGATAAQSGAGPAASSAGNTPYLPIPFTFEALTDWSRFEAAVTRRAAKLFSALPSGMLPRPGSRASNPGDHEMMRFQGFGESPKTGEARMAEVRAKLASERKTGPGSGDAKPYPGEPLDFETAIELPARLILSTAQDAIWRTNRRMPATVLASKDGAATPVGPADESPPRLEEGDSLAGPETVVGQPRDLWSVRLDIDEKTPPWLRAVSSPDLRLDALDVSQGRQLQLPGRGAPPRGPYAPWFVGPEQAESGTLTAKEVYDALPEGTKPPLPAQPPGPEPKDPDVCDAPKVTTGFRLIRWLCERAGFREALPPEDYAFFRTSLDAFDRHQLVLLTSAYGLPVIGKRQAFAPEGKNVGDLVPDSGQIEPGEAFSLLDATDDQALHKPVPLKVKALTLSALGGSLLHETAFKPSAGADDIFGNKIFEGFSIDTLQQDIVLGRDVRTEVVYKGYLLPLGHKASFVKLTERVFLRTPSQGVKAMLRQRMYLRMADRNKLYGALGQPHGGRMWCGKLVSLLADKTPDILDPTFPIDGEVTPTHPESLNGRIYLGGGPGLAFWPRTDITEAGLYRFDITIDGTPTSLPMIFVDNIAATTAKSLKAAVDHYNGRFQDPVDGPFPEPIEPAEKIHLETETRERRTLATRGLEIDYAPNSRAGEAQFETEAIHIRAHGRSLSAFAVDWVEPLEAEANFTTTGVLEGANQPPFYPAMEKAVIRIGSAERLSGGKRQPVEVQYDGHYVLYGFNGDPLPAGLEPTEKEDGTPTRFGNPKEVFLNLRDPVTLGMGGNGDRSGGIARPNAHLVAISRKFGPMGGDVSTWWATSRTFPDPDLTPIDPGDDGGPVFAKIDADKTAGRLVSLAPYFNDAIKRPVVLQRRPQKDEENSQPFKVDPKSDTLTEAVKQVQSFFSLDAKLLGTVRLKDLMALLDLSADDIPVLKEVQEFGTAALREAEDEADGLSNDVRTRVLAPLRDVIALLRSAWNKLDRELAKKQKDLLDAVPGNAEKAAPFKPFELREIYPEIDAGLVKVEAALAAALATEDALALVPQLAELYSVTREFIRALAIVAANPVERLQEGFTASLNELAGVLARLEALADSLEQLPKQISEGAADQIADRITAWLFEKAVDPSLDANPIVELLSPGAIPPDLKAVLKALVPNAEAELAEFWTAVAADPNGIAATLRDKFVETTRGGVRATLRASLVELFTSGSPEAAAKAGTANFRSETEAGYAEAIEDAKEAVSDFAGTIEEGKKELLSQVKLALQEALDFFVDELFETIAGEYPQVLQVVAARLQWADTTIDHARRVADAVNSGDPRKILEASAAFSQEVLGVDAGGLAAGYVNDVEMPLAKAVGEAAGLLRDGQLKVDDAAALLSEAGLCAAFHEDGKALSIPKNGSGIVTSSKALKPVAEALNALAELQAELEKLDAPGGPLSDPLIKTVNGLEAKVRTLHADVSGLVYKSPSANLRQLTSEVFCDIVRLQIAMRDWTPPTALDEAGIERIGNLARLVTALGRSIASGLGTMADLLSAFFVKHGPEVGAGLVGAAVVTVINGEVDFSKLEKKNRDILDTLKGKAETAEAALVATARGLAGQGLGLLSKSTVVPVGAGEAMIAALAKIEETAKGFGLTLKPEVETLSKTLTALKSTIASYQGLGVPPDIKTVKALLAADLGGGKTFSAFFASETSSQFRQAAEGVRKLEDAVQRELLVLQSRIKGAPDEIRNAVLAVAAGWNVFSVSASGYGEIKKVRDDVLDRVAAVGPFAPIARKALLVATDAGLAANGTPACAVDDPEQGLDTLKNCDRLSQEWEVLKAASGFAGVTDEVQKAALRQRIVAFYTGWASGDAAPLKIIAQAGEMAKNILRGDVLAAIDLGAFRDQIEDAIAALIPTKVHFSYDFASSVETPPDDQAIFQPKLGAPFGIKVRATADLLTQKTDFLATAHIGPFDIYLIGGLIDALRLKFGGAAFSIGDGTSGRFDVQYEDFVIGEDLAFAQQLQSYLNPKEGSGVFIQPMTRGAGVEAGYSLFLGTIGVGVTSFSNVSLAVSAELPFDDTESLFKVSLGRRMAPFTMGVFPFVGCGYFSIYAAADGVRGFEAAFEYGGGAAIGYGPLEAQVRISAGVFIRIIKVDGRRTTEIYGTFFAGGSASIWIFHFATSLYVRLGRAAGGEMYGEAIYSFSFSLGFAKYKYSITVSKQEKPLGGGTKEAALHLLDGSFRYAASDGAGFGVDLIVTGQTDASRPIVVKAKGQGEWDAYAQYFDPGLLTGALP